MLPRNKCCLHCPGTWKLARDSKDHNCCLTTYIKGNLKVSTSKNHVLENRERSDGYQGSSERSPSSHQNSVNDRFAIAKKFHADNLQHQPLPDKVHDSVFKNIRPGQRYLTKSNPDLTKNIDLSAYRGPKKNTHKRGNPLLQYGPSLGCKTPTTNMDLAICWEAPIDPTYEPPWPVHIDGSDGGPGPAIFALVQRETEDEKSYKSPVDRFEAKFNYVKERFKRSEYPTNRQSRHFCKPEKLDDNPHQECLIYPDDQEITKHSDDLCENFDSVDISNVSNRRIKSGTLTNLRKRQPIHLRNSETCECKGDRTRRPRSRSIHSAPVASQGKRNFPRNGLPNKVTVPRPRTPYAKREFCIDTLTPPFSIVEGCRDADYPEHWRLTSVYQQSYRNPQRHF